MKSKTECIVWGFGPTMAPSESLPAAGLIRRQR
nr:MAG TPA: Dynein heavy chain AAA lid domain [Caudoviricetes sp.]